MLERPADDLFEPGEAVLQPDAHMILRHFAASARNGIMISSEGTDAATLRFDGWELAAARAAAVARELAAAGIPEARIKVAIDPRTGGGQILRLSRDPR
jgi:flagellar motor protein MotB